jgi:hypothetical protein
MTRMDEKLEEQRFYESLGERKWRFPWLLIGLVIGALSGWIYFKSCCECARDVPRDHAWPELVLIGCGIGFTLGLATDLALGRFHRVSES